MMARLVQQCENQCIRADQWMEREPAIKTNETGAGQTKRLRVNDPRLRIDFILDAGERGPKFR
jgi:glycerol-3-phosphate dehydrogenase